MIDHHLATRDLELVGRNESPTAVVIDSQSIKTDEGGGIRDCDGGKKIRRRKQHALVNTDEQELKLQVHVADA